MSARGEQILQTAERQITELLALATESDGQLLRSPCPGREQLGDGTIGAVAQHIAGNYVRIAKFAQTGGAPYPADAVAERNAHNPPDSIGHPRHAARHGGGHPVVHTEPRALTAQLLVARDELGAIAQLTDRQLDSVPPEGSFRFSDGQRTLQQVLANLVKHQGRQLDAITAAIKPDRSS
jgi:hypothetical protein